MPGLCPATLLAVRGVHGVIVLAFPDYMPSPTPSLLAYSLFLHAAVSRLHDTGATQVPHQLARVLSADDRQPAHVLRQHALHCVAQQLIGVRHNEIALTCLQ